MMFIEIISNNIADWGPRLLHGLHLTLSLTASGFCLAVMLAMLIEYLRSRRALVPQLVSRVYITVARGVPILVILYLLYFALPGAGVTLSAFMAGTLGLSAVYAAYLAEVFRAGFCAISAGQREAALAAGLTPLAAFRLILLPQAIRQTVAPLLINLVSLMKDSSICALISVPELTLVSRELMSESFLPLHVFALTALLYFSLAWPASIAARIIEHRLQGRARLRAHRSALPSLLARTCP
ncbi:MULTISPECIES: amino acid ABC transporter permease [unclassified Rhizobium]|uniref:amino acid ABC transporter permease n=1 Tax=unclassified Rhizobium TaxID=2613769 RepID=UPI00161C4FBC|nr:MULTISPECIES: amino acid ABC transporter permease [unclassified Rhizobium]MBB3320445.1 polar amino acid transport system permease protein [Rhizobium sp. BK181]MCS3743600.1 polar amino acid transport system permease protein [Rhizobium sp. BK661]MCS4096192.1 polar amino acid transport system permease protein [Rhizobium sp. BK176]